jgi:hypothetical protein
MRTAYNVHLKPGQFSIMAPGDIVVLSGQATNIGGQGLPLFQPFSSRQFATPTIVIRSLTSQRYPCPQGNLARVSRWHRQPMPPEEDKGRAPYASFIRLYRNHSSGNSVRWGFAFLARNSLTLLVSPDSTATAQAGQDERRQGWRYL